MKTLVILFLFLISSAHGYEIYPECKAEVSKKILGYKVSPNLNWPSWVTQINNTNCNHESNDKKHSSFTSAIDLSLNVDNISKSLLDNIYTKGDTSRLRKIILDCQGRVEANHKLAALAAEQVYDFKAPPGYKIIQKVEQNDKQNIRSGIKLYILGPIDENLNAKLPYILSFAGTKDLKDAASDLGFGADHYEDIRHLLRSGSTVFKKLQEGRDLIITGHSLGGGLAQAAAATLIESVANQQLVDKKFKRGGPPDSWGNIKLVTFNSFGGEKLKGYADRHLQEQFDAQGAFKGLPAKNSLQNIEDRKNLDALTKDLKESALNQSVHYRMENDAVSKLGSHYGERRLIKPELSLAQTVAPLVPFAKLVVVGEAHLMGNVKKTLANNGYEKATVEKGKEIGLGNWFTEITNLAYSHDIAALPKKLKEEQIEEYKKQGLYK